VARETGAGRRVHLVVCSRGEAGTNGTPRQRTAEAKAAARILGATIEFVELDGDARLEVSSAHARRLARVIRRLQPGVVLAPTDVPTQHPDHWRLGQLVRDAVRLARYGGLRDLRPLAPHTVGGLFFYALAPSAEPKGATPVVIDVSSPVVVDRWRRAMEAHASQLKTRDYVELQLARARVHGLDAGVGHAQQLYPDAPLVFASLAPLTRAARRF